VEGWRGWGWRVEGWGMEDRGQRIEDRGKRKEIGVVDVRYIQ
jgi:hypothetical protein